MLDPGDLLPPPLKYGPQCPPPTPYGVVTMIYSL